MRNNFDQSIQIKSFSDQTQADALRVINAYLTGWPYTRPLTLELLAYWQTLPSFQPDNFLIAYRAGEPVACLHGEITEQTVKIPLVALRPGAVAEALYLLQQVENRGKTSGLKQLVSPTGLGTPYYLGYILGAEPYHPHWATEGTRVYIQAGYRPALTSVLMVRDLTTKITVSSAPSGYEIVETTDRDEYEARAFGYLAFYRGKKVAHCYARLYPHLKSYDDRPVGQICPVGTDEAHRDRGLASAMTGMCLQQLQEWGASTALIATQLDNEPALRAYERSGFKRQHLLLSWLKEI